MAISRTVRTVLLVGAATVAVTLAPVSTSAVARSDTVNSNAATATAEIEEYHFGSDTASYAADFGVPLETAAYNLWLQEQAGKVAEATAAEFPDGWVGHFVTHGERFTVRFLVSDNRAATRLGELLLDVPGLSSVSVFQHRALSLLELEGAAATLLAASPLERPFDVDIDLDAQRILVQTTTADLANTLRLIAASDGLVPDVAVEIVAAVSKPNINIYGGLALHPDCTSGFTVVGGGNRGIVWAGHCPNASHQGVTLTTQSTAYGGSSDLKWARASGHTYPNWIYDSLPYDYIRSITSTKSRSATGIGDYVCHYGRSTGYGCGQVISKTKAPSYIPSATTTYIEVQDDTSPYANLSSGGDSGGPWFYSSTAWGVHTGGAGPNPHGKTNGIYTSVSYLGNLGSVSIATTSG